MVLAGGGGLLTCWGAISTRVHVASIDSEGFGSWVLLPPITGPNPTLPLVALAVGLVMVVLAISFIVFRRAERRALLAVTLIVLGIGTAMAFTDLRIGDAASLVPVEMRGGVAVCGTGTLGPCLRVYWPTELCLGADPGAFELG